MNYKQIYNNLINRAKERLVEGYTESHHIIPRCMGGDDSKSNLVNLTPEEHYTAHLLLVKIYPDNKKLVKAATMMIPNRPSNKLYGWLRRRFSEVQKEAQSGTSNSQFGTKWIHNKELRVSKKVPITDILSTGWELGRVIRWDTSKKAKPVSYNSCPECGNVKNSLKKFCGHSCATTYNNRLKDTKFEEHLEGMLKDYQNGMSIYKCLVSRKLCGTGLNHTKLKQAIDKWGFAKWEGSGF